MSNKVIQYALIVVASICSSAWGQLPAQFVKMSQDGTPIPDVNKSPLPPLPGDSSCWLASASNILAAAGYGTGGPAQQRAQVIYSQLTAAYGIASGGAPDQAISYWLAWYGKNPNSLEYNPALNYTDVTAEYRTLTPADYAFLQNELFRCQYVGVQFDNPAHAVTFVGWDNTFNRSIWHDSDRNVGLNGVDAYNNSYTTQWDLVDPLTQTTYLSRANGYLTFCPGLDKHPSFVASYDLAWAPSPLGPMARVAGLYAGQYQSLGWLGQWIDPNDPNTTLERFHLGNQAQPNHEKHIQLLVDYYGRDTNYLNEDIRLRYFDGSGIEVIAAPTSAQLSADAGQVLFTWDLDYQPGWEEILFPSYMDYGLLEGTVASWDIATICSLHPGDANSDGLVNLSDLQILGDNWQSAGASWAQADFNGDGIVNLADLQIIGDNWGYGTGPDVGFDQALASVAIPEPYSLSMLCILGVGLISRRRSHPHLNRPAARRSGPMRRWLRCSR
ncbi:MAG: PEP-CTERM sorting domain-containing protein [Phycisphaeraceae bacterium]|nr:PEP-CTERM sorting domain-containing protein [Phycisphaeraceae bacterium]